MVAESCCLNRTNAQFRTRNRFLKKICNLIDLLCRSYNPRELCKFFRLLSNWSIMLESKTNVAAFILHVE